MKNGLIIDEFGNKSYYLNGLLHREDGHAFEDSNGGKAYYINGRLHREDGPAIEWKNGYKEWCISGMRHREDGPARIWEGRIQYEEYYIHGTYFLHEEDYWKEIKRIKSLNYILSNLIK